MKGAGITAFSAPVGTLELAEPRDLSATDVALDVHAAGVGNWDELVRIGSWQIGGPPPMALGVEAAGTITMVGDAVTGFTVGDEVLTHPLPLRRYGTWAQRVLAPETTLGLKPPSVPFETAAAFPVPALTAIQVLDEALRVERGEWLLVHGGSGVTGGLLVQLAASKGALVVATASKANFPRLLKYGAKEVLDYHNANWPRHVAEIAGEDGVPKVANLVRGGAGTALRAAAAGGRLATITGDPPRSERDITISNVYVRPDGHQLTALAEMLGAGSLVLEIDSAHSLEDAAAALTKAASGHARGAIVISLTDPRV
jgi:NADPH:quinone reductase-like Zn-dependent oxidoreductase